jgi:prepilin-type N-terminal cleavage/methylation domain-containing protein
MKHPRTHLVRFLRGFSLLELLVAMAILSMLMTMMFSLLGGTISLWEIGNKRIEAAQTARVGLNIIANDLRRAISDQQVSYTANGTAITNTVPFFATTNTIDLGDKATNARGSGQLFGVLATGKTNQPFEEFGYLCAYLKKSDDDNYMVSNKYYLVRKYSTNNNADFSTNKADFYLQGNATTSFATTSDALVPIIENCVRLEFSYPVTNASGGIDFTNTWNSQTNLPLGVLVSVWVLDSRTADKIADISSSNELSSEQINSITNAAPSTDTVDRLLQRGAVRMRRFIPLNQH